MFNNLIVSAVRVPTIDAHNGIAWIGYQGSVSLGNRHNFIAASTQRKFQDAIVDFVIEQAVEYIETVRDYERREYYGDYDEVPDCHDGRVCVHPYAPSCVGCGFEVVEDIPF